MSKPDWSDPSQTWTLSLRQKRALFSEDNLPLPGGQLPGGQSSDQKPKGVKQDELLPVFFHESGELLAAELIHALQPRSVIDMTPGSGHWAFVCACQRVPYCGVCFTDTHRDMLYRRLISRTIDAMCDANSDLYDPSFAQLLGQSKGEGAKPVPKPKPTPKPSKNPNSGSGNDQSGDLAIAICLNQTCPLCLVWIFFRFRLRNALRL